MTAPPMRDPDYLPPPVDPPPSDEELRYYAGLLAWIMQPTTDRAEVLDTAQHVWRVTLSVEEHERLRQFVPLAVRDEVCRCGHGQGEHWRNEGACTYSTMAEVWGCDCEEFAADAVRDLVRGPRSSPRLTRRFAD